jgi:hypothetical protein
MGGLVGGVSNKIILVAATLTFTARVDFEHVRALLSPQATVSAVSTRLSRKLQLPGNGASPSSKHSRRQVDIGIGAEEMRVDAKIVSDLSLPADIDLRIGRDMLDHLIDVDLKHQRIRLFLRSEYFRATRGLTAIVLTPREDGSWTLPTRVAGLTSETGILDFSSESELMLPAAIASVAHIGDGTVVETTIGTAQPIGRKVHIRDMAGSLPVLGWQTFSGRDVLLDLGHNRIWLRSDATASTDAMR